jgi:hypothetical protein
MTTRPEWRIEADALTRAAEDVEPMSPLAADFLRQRAARIVQTGKRLDGLPATCPTCHGDQTLLSLASTGHATDGDQAQALSFTQVPCPTCSGRDSVR